MDMSAATATHYQFRKVPQYHLKSPPLGQPTATAAAMASSSAHMQVTADIQQVQVLQEVLQDLDQQAVAAGYAMDLILKAWTMNSLRTLCIGQIQQHRHIQIISSRVG